MHVPSGASCIAALCLAVLPRSHVEGRDHSRQSFLQTVTVCHAAGMCRWNATGERSITERYLFTMRMSLTGALLSSPYFMILPSGQIREGNFNATSRYLGGDWPVYGQTMTGVLRLELLHSLLHKAYVEKGLTGDFLEAGVWRGGNCIYAKAFMEAYGIHARVWVADSFQGLPGKAHPRDSGEWRQFPLAVSVRQVRDYFKRYQLLDSSVEFVEGFFDQSLPPLRRRVKRLAVMRIDGDMYKSTLDVLCNLYDRLEVGGFWVADDWNVYFSRNAIWDFVRAHNITERPVATGDGSAWFEKRVDVPVNEAWCRKRLDGG